MCCSRGEEDDKEWNMAGRQERQERGDPAGGLLRGIMTGTKWQVKAGNKVVCVH